MTKKILSFLILLVFLSGTYALCACKDALAAQETKASNSQCHHESQQQKPEADCGHCKITASDCSASLTQTREFTENHSAGKILLHNFFNEIKTLTPVFSETVVLSRHETRQSPPLYLLYSSLLI